MHRPVGQMEIRSCRQNKRGFIGGQQPELRRETRSREPRVTSEKPPPTRRQGPGKERGQAARKEVSHQPALAPRGTEGSPSPGSEQPMDPEPDPPQLQRRQAPGKGTPAPSTPCPEGSRGRPAYIRQNQYQVKKGNQRQRWTSHPEKGRPIKTNNTYSARAQRRSQKTRAAHSRKSSTQ